MSDMRIGTRADAHCLHGQPVIVLACTIGLAACSGSPTSPDTGLGDELAGRFQQAIEAQSAANGVIGMQAAVIVPGVGAWDGVYGRSGATSGMEADMLIPLGSVAKTVISGLVLDLVDDGLLGLDDTMGELLPPLDNVPPEVTVAQILRNSSGIASYSSAPGFSEAVFGDPERVWTREEVIRTFVGPPEFPPDAAWKSSNTGYMLAEMIAESVTGEHLIDLYRNRLYEPFDLTGIAVVGEDAPSNPLAVTWSGAAGGPFTDFSATFGSPSFRTALGFVGSTVMNAKTLARWGQVLFEELLSDSIRSAMLTAVPDDGSITGQTGAGLGVRRYNWNGGTQWGHSGTIINGSAFLLYDTGTRIVVALTYNQSGGSHFNSHFGLVQTLLQLALTAVASG